MNKENIEIGTIPTPSKTMRKVGMVPFVPSWFKWSFGLLTELQQYFVKSFTKNNPFVVSKAHPASFSHESP
jgi:hypothetical protein